MRTIATLNLPAATSGIWRSAPALAPVPAQAVEADPDPLGAAPLLLGVVPELQAPTMSTAVAKSGNNLEREAAMAVSSSTIVRGFGRDGISALCSAIERRARTVPGRNGRPEG
jgi:hypothetical protein